MPLDSLAGPLAAAAARDAAAAAAAAAARSAAPLPLAVELPQVGLGPVFALAACRADTHQHILSLWAAARSPLLSHLLSNFPSFALVEHYPNVPLPTTSTTTIEPSQQLTTLTTPDHTRRPHPNYHTTYPSWPRNIGTQSISIRQKTNRQWELLNMYIDIQKLLLIAGIETNPGPNKNQFASKLSLAHVNINSITAPGKLDELQQFVETNAIQILALSETKTDSTVHPSQYTLSNFQTSNILSNIEHDMEEAQQSMLKYHYP